MALSKHIIRYVSDASYSSITIFITRYFFWILALLFAVAQIFCGLNQDNKALLFFTTEFITHGNGYEHWFETNPPLFILIYSIPAAFIIWLKATPAIAFQAYAITMDAGSVLAVRHVLTNIEPVWRIRMVNAALFILFVLPCCVLVFGDRDHFIFILSLPWIMQMLWSIRPTWQTIIPAAIGFCIKPHSLLIAAVLILFSINYPKLRDKLLSTSALLITGMVCLYLLVLEIFFRFYLNEVLPLVLTVYPSLHFPISERIPLFIGCLASSCVLIYLCRMHIKESAAWYAFVTASCGRMMLDNGWFYTHYLAILPLMLICFRALPPQVFRIENVREKISAGVYYIPVFIGVLWFSWQSALATYDNLKSTAEFGYASNYNVMPESLHSDLRRAAGKEFVLLSNTLQSYDISDFGNTPKELYTYQLWPIPWLRSHSNDKNASWIIEGIGKRIIDAFNTKPAPMLIVDVSPFQLGLSYKFDLLGYLKMNYPPLTAALDNYTFERTIDYCSANVMLMCHFDVYKPKVAQ